MKHEAHHFSKCVWELRSQATISSLWDRFFPALSLSLSFRIFFHSCIFHFTTYYSITSKDIGCVSFDFSIFVFVYGWKKERPLISLDIFQPHFLPKYVPSILFCTAKHKRLGFCTLNRLRLLLLLYQSFKKYHWPDSLTVLAFYSLHSFRWCIHLGLNRFALFAAYLFLDQARYQGVSGTIAIFPIDFYWLWTVMSWHLDRNSIL